MMDCARFLEEYSEFRDGILPPETAIEFEAHLDDCPSCARYHRVVERGARLFCDLPELEPSEDFLPRLQHRIYHLEDEMRGPGRAGSGVSASMVLSIAAVLAFSAWVPVLRSQPELKRLPAVTARAPQGGMEGVPLFVSGPLLTHTALLHRDLNDDSHAVHDQHLLFSYFPVGAPAAIRTAALD